jgi:hypothetical protein
MTMNTDKPLRPLPNPWDGVPEEPDAEDSAAIAAKDLMPIDNADDEDDLWSEEGQEH